MMLTPRCRDAALSAGDSLIQAAAGCRNYELLAACALSCAHWLSSVDSLSLNPDAQPHGPLRAPPGADTNLYPLAMANFLKSRANTGCTPRFNWQCC
jgi:hypothetical protein